MDAVTKSKTPEAVVIDGLAFPFPDYPAPGTATEVADGIFWISTAVPFVGLKQVNLWLVRDGDGWTMIDCGYGSDAVRDLITSVWANVLQGRPITRLIVTHFHPDHAGGSGWIAERWGLRPYMSHCEWLTASLAVLNRNTDHVQSRGTFYRRHGLDEARVQRFLTEVVLYSDGVTLPKSYKRLRGDDILTHRRGPLARRHRRRPFARARFALLRRTENPDRRRSDPADDHHQCQHLAGGAGVRRRRRVPRHLQAVSRPARRRYAGAAVASQAVP
jgi:hypothetical protein